LVAKKESILEVDIEIEAGDRSPDRGSPHDPFQVPQNAAAPAQWWELGPTSTSNVLAPPPVLGWGGDVQRRSSAAWLEKMSTWRERTAAWREIASRVVGTLRARRRLLALGAVWIATTVGLGSLIEFVRAERAEARSEATKAAALALAAERHEPQAASEERPNAQGVEPKAADSDPRDDLNSLAASGVTATASRTAKSTLRAGQANADKKNKPAAPAETVPAPAAAPPRRSAESEAPPAVTTAVRATAPSPSDVDTTADFDRNAAMGALRQAGDSARSCGGASGSVRVSVTFARPGNVMDAHVEGPAAGTPSGACIAGKFRSLKIPAFRGSSVTVYKTVMF
jgi:hypothetical protein